MRRDSNERELLVPIARAAVGRQPGLGYPAPFAPRRGAGHNEEATAYMSRGLIAERAGAVVTDVKGNPWWDPRVRGARASVVAAPDAQHRPLLEVLAALKTTVQSRH